MMKRDEIVRSYAMAWQETDEARRSELLQVTWFADGVYCDRMARAEGHEALPGLITMYQQQVPGLTVDLATEVDGHNQFLRPVVDRGQLTVNEEMDPTGGTLGRSGATPTGTGGRRLAPNPHLVTRLRVAMACGAGQKATID
jgi:hypothetical protein